MPFRLFVSGLEIVATVLVLIPRTQAFGGLFSMGIMGGAILFHLFTPLGVDTYEDGGNLFKEAGFTFAMGAVIVVARWNEVMGLAGRVPVLRDILAPLLPRSS